MERLVILVGRPNKSLTPTKYFFYVPLFGRFMPLVDVIRRPVESPLPTEPILAETTRYCRLVTTHGLHSGAESTDVYNTQSPGWATPI